MKTDASLEPFKKKKMCIIKDPTEQNTALQTQKAKWNTKMF